MVIRSVDYNCQPMPNMPLTIKDYKRQFLTPDSVSKTEISTDNNGFAVYDRKHDSDLIIMARKFSNGSSHSSRYRTYMRMLLTRGEGSYEELYHVLNNSSKDNPIYIYPYEKYPENHYRQRTKRQNIGPIHSSISTNHIITGSSSTDEYVSAIYIQERENDFQIELRNPRDGGLIAIPKATLPFSETIPMTGYNRMLTWIVPKTTVYPKTEQSLYYFKNSNNEYGILTLDISFVSNNIIINYFIDAVFKTTTGSPLVLKQEKCGGVAARHYDGYYGHIHEGRRLEESLKALARFPHKRVNEAKNLYATAKNIDTEDQWYLNQGPNEPYALAAIDNNAAIAHRLSMLYKLHDTQVEPGKIRTHKYQKLMVRLAADLRTPPEVLTALYKLDLAGAIKFNLLSNPATPQNIADKLAIGLAKSSEKIQGYERMTFDTQFIYSLFKSNSVSANALNESIKVYPNQSSISSPHVVYQDSRVSPESLSYLYNIAKEKKGGLKKVIADLLRNTNTPVTVLRDIYRFLSQSRYIYRKNAYLLLLLNNPQTPNELFYDLFETKKSRHLLAESIRTPIDIWEQIILENDRPRGDAKTIRTIAMNPAVPQFLLKKLSKKYFREVIKNKSLTAAEFAHYFSNFQDDKLIQEYTGTLINHPKTPVEVLEKIYVNNRQGSQFGLAKNKNTPVYILNASYGRSTQIDQLLASNPNIDDILIDMIMNEGQLSSLISALAANPATSSEVLWRIFKDDYRITDRQHPQRTNQLGLYCNPATPEKLREQLPYLLNHDCI